MDGRHEAAEHVFTERVSVSLRGRFGQFVWWLGDGGMVLLLMFIAGALGVGKVKS